LRDLLPWATARTQVFSQWKGERKVGVDHCIDSRRLVAGVRVDRWIDRHIGEFGDGHGWIGECEVGGDRWIGGFESQGVGHIFFGAKVGRKREGDVVIENWIDRIERRKVSGLGQQGLRRVVNGIVRRYDGFGYGKGVRDNWSRRDRSERSSFIHEVAMVILLCSVVQPLICSFSVSTSLTKQMLHRFQSHTYIS
jgi:hypothetical protein